jgi:hypothetical protein
MTRWKPKPRQRPSRTPTQDRNNQEISLELLSEAHDCRATAKYLRCQINEGRFRHLACKGPSLWPSTSPPSTVTGSRKWERACRRCRGVLVPHVAHFRVSIWHGQGDPRVQSTSKSRVAATRTRSRANPCSHEHARPRPLRRLLGVGNSTNPKLLLEQCCCVFNSMMSETVLVYTCFD